MSRQRGNDLIRIGLRIREARKSRHMTLDHLARQAGLSKGLLSKVENFRAIASLPVLAAIARALRVDLGELVRGIGLEEPQPSVLVRAGERTRVERDDAVGFLYQAILTRPIGDTAFEAMVLTLKPKSRRKAVTSDGDQFIFILNGRIEFIYGKETLTLEAGDAFFFDGRIPHVPRNTSTSASASLLAIYLLRNEKGVL
jgi:transcriptional regulator with XRE-family HTH domain